MALFGQEGGDASMCLVMALVLRVAEPTLCVRPIQLVICSGIWRAPRQCETALHTVVEVIAHGQRGSDRRGHVGTNAFRRKHDVAGSGGLREVVLTGVG
jgi:hypothetical protein